MMIKVLKAAILAGAMLAPTALASPAVQSACSAETAGGKFDCGCVGSKFDAATSGLPANTSDILGDFLAQGMGDPSAQARIAARPPTDFIAAADHLDAVPGILETCLSSNFTARLEDAETAAVAKEAEANRLAALEQARRDAIPTAPPPPEVTSPPNPLPPTGPAGKLAASSARGTVIAECRGFGNSIGFCACMADQFVSQLTPEQRRGKFVLDQVGAQVDTGQVSPMDMDPAITARLRITDRQLSTLRAQINAVTNSYYDDAQAACEAYQ